MLVIELNGVVLRVKALILNCFCFGLNQIEKHQIKTAKKGF